MCMYYTLIVFYSFVVCVSCDCGSYLQKLSCIEMVYYRLYKDISVSVACEYCMTRACNLH